MLPDRYIFCCCGLVFMRPIDDGIMVSPALVGIMFCVRIDAAVVAVAIKGRRAVAVTASRRNMVSKNCDGTTERFLCAVSAGYCPLGGCLFRVQQEQLCEGGRHRRKELPSLFAVTRVLLTILLYNYYCV